MDSYVYFISHQRQLARYMFCLPVFVVTLCCKLFKLKTLSCRREIARMAKVKWTCRCSEIILSSCFSGRSSSWSLSLHTLTDMSAKNHCAIIVTFFVAMTTLCIVVVDSVSASTLVVRTLFCCRCRLTHTHTPSSASPSSSFTRSSRLIKTKETRT